jgi:hypothetical protein
MSCSVAGKFLASLFPIGRPTGRFSKGQVNLLASGPSSGVLASAVDGSSRGRGERSVSLYCCSSRDLSLGCLHGLWCLATCFLYS